MSRRGTVPMLSTQDQKEGIYLLWDRIADCDGSDAETALTVLLEGACQLLEAGNADLSIAIRLPAADRGDPMLGWRIRELIHLREQTEITAQCKEHLAEFEQGGAAEPVREHFRRAGRFRGNLLRDISPPGFFESPAFAHNFGSVGISDHMTVTTPLGSDVESAISFYRLHGAPPFTHSDLELAVDILRPLKWLQRRVALSYGLLVTDDPLTPAERRVLPLLLTEKTEKEIAASLSVSFQTVHKHVKKIYRKLNVSSRAGVAALWLGNGEPGSPQNRALRPAGY